ncbi:MAG: type II toxin-antitoxin system prevent-host-death family antitoxin [Geminicoccaceae bacterium]|nr:MAG: type II toxin-antitoxin system prevent-host-death family antitoxin [Geminicoccaceae bacterium]
MDPELRDLVRRVQAGHEVVLTERGCALARLVPIAPPPQSRDERLAIIERIQASARAKRRPDVPAERSQDFLYDEDGLPQ